MRDLDRRFQAFLRDERGATAVEYGLILALVAVFVLVGVTNVGNALVGDFNKVANKLP